MRSKVSYRPHNHYGLGGNWHVPGWVVTSVGEAQCLLSRPRTLCTHASVFPGSWANPMALSSHLHPIFHIRVLMPSSG